MADHNFTTDTYDANTAVLDECKKHIAEVVLPSEPASQFGVFSWFEVNAINSILGQVSQLFEGQAYMYRFAKKGVCLTDDEYAPKFDDPLEDIILLTSTIKNMLITMRTNCQSASFLDLSNSTWVKSSIAQLLYSSIHKIYEENLFETMTDEGLKSYCASFINMDEFILTENEKIKIQELITYLIKYKPYTLKNEVVALYEMINGEVGIRSINKSAWTDLSEERMIYAKYLKCCGWSDIFISKFFTNRIKCFSTVEAESSFPDFEESECIRQGNFELCDLSITHNQVGEANFTFDARQRPAAPCEGAVIVYDSRGSIINYKKLNRYQRPVNLVDFIGTAYDEFKGKDYAETHVEVTIPQGGFVEITDDPAIMETIPLILETQQMVISSQESLEFAQSLSDGAPDLTKSADSFAAAFDIANAIVNLIHDKEADLWSQEQENSGSFVLYNYR